MIRIILKEEIATLGGISKVNTKDQEVDRAGKRGTSVQFESDEEVLQSVRKINSSTFKQIVPALIRYIQQDPDKTKDFTSIVKHINGFEQDVSAKLSAAKQNGNQDLNEASLSGIYQYVKGKFLDFNTKITRLFSNRSVQLITLAALLYNLYDNMSDVPNIDTAKITEIFKLVAKLASVILSGGVPDKETVGAVTSEITELLLGGVISEGRTLKESFEWGEALKTYSLTEYPGNFRKQIESKYGLFKAKSGNNAGRLFVDYNEELEDKKIYYVKTETSIGTFESFHFLFDLYEYELVKVNEELTFTKEYDNKKFSSSEFSFDKYFEKHFWPIIPPKEPSDQLETDDIGPFQNKPTEYGHRDLEHDNDPKLNSKQFNSKPKSDRSVEDRFSTLEPHSEPTVPKDRQPHWQDKWGSFSTKPNWLTKVKKKDRRDLELDEQKTLKESAENLHYYVVLQFKVEPDTKVYGDLYNEIRAIPGVTIVRSAAKVELDSNTNKIFTLRIKFLSSSGEIGVYLKNLREYILRLSDAEGDNVLGCKILSAPQKIKSDKQSKPGIKTVKDVNS